MKELADLAANGLTQEQLDAARTFEINHFPFEIETPRRLLGMRMDELLWGTPEFAGSFAGAASLVTTEDVKRATAHAIDVNNMIIVAVVSDGEAFVKELLGDAVLVQYPSGVDPRGLREDDLRYNNFLPAYEPQKIRVVKASTMFQ
jgi:zinc protease